MVAEHLWVRIQQGAQEIAARSGSGQDDKSRHCSHLVDAKNLSETGPGPLEASRFIAFLSSSERGSPSFSDRYDVDSAAAVRTGRIKLLGCNRCVMLRNELTTLKSFGQHPIGDTVVGHSDQLITTASHGADSILGNLSRQNIATGQIESQQRAPVVGHDHRFWIEETDPFGGTMTQRERVEQSAIFDAIDFHGEIAGNTGDEISAGIDVHIVHDRHVTEKPLQQIALEVPCEQCSVGTAAHAERFRRMQSQSFDSAIVNTNGILNLPLCD